MDPLGFVVYLFFNNDEPQIREEIIRLPSFVDHIKREQNRLVINRTKVKACHCSHSDRLETSRLPTAAFPPGILIRVEPKLITGCK